MRYVDLIVAQVEGQVRVVANDGITVNGENRKKRFLSCGVQVVQGSRKVDRETEPVW